MSMDTKEAAKTWKLFGFDRSLSSGLCAEVRFISYSRGAAVGARCLHVATEKEFLDAITGTRRSELVALSLHSRIGGGTKSADVKDVGTFFLDIEPDNAKGSVATLKQKVACIKFAEEHVVGWFKKAGLKSPVLADSGNGVHVFAPFPSQPLSGGSNLPSKFKSLTLRIEADVSVPLLAAGLRIDHAFDLARVVKVHGSRKPISGSHPSKFLTNADREEDSELLKLFDSLPEPSGRTRAAPSGPKITPEHLDEKHIPPMFERLLKREPRLRAAYEGTLDDLNDCTRSGQDLSLVSQLARSGIVDTTALAAILYSAPHEKAREAKPPERYIARTIATAMASLPEGLAPGSGAKDIVGAPHYLNPAQDFRDGCAYLGVELIVEKTTEVDGKSVRAKVPAPFLVTSDRRRLPIRTPKGGGLIEIPGTVYQANKIPQGVGCDWPLEGRYGLTAFLEGNDPQVDTRLLLQALRNFVEDYVIFPDRSDLLLAALTILLSYCYRLFDSTPYLLIVGPKGSGKSTTGRAIHAVAFNAEMTTNCSAASLFRTLDRTSGLFVLDETEGMSTRSRSAEDPRSDLIKGGYQRGSKVTRQDQNDASKTLYFDIFSPKVICNIHGLDDVLSDRTIPIQTRRLGRKESRSLSRSRLSRGAERAQRLRSLLYCWTMQNHRAISSLRDELDLDDLGFHGRDFELWFPPFVLAEFCRRAGVPGATKELLGLATRKQDLREATRVDGPEERVLSILAEKMEESGASYLELTMDEIEEALAAELEEPLDRKALGAILKTLGVTCVRRNRVKDEDGKERKVRVYRARATMLRGAA